MIAFIAPCSENNRINDSCVCVCVCVCLCVCMCVCVCVCVCASALLLSSIRTPLSMCCSRSGNETKTRLHCSHSAMTTPDSTAHKRLQPWKSERQRERERQGDRASERERV